MSQSRKSRPNELQKREMQVRATALIDRRIKELERQMAPARPQAPLLVCPADVGPEPVGWLWPGRIALGKLTLLAGDPGKGKSLLTIDMAARVTTGRAWPDGPATAPLGGVVLLNAEDDLVDTIRPRLDAAGADLKRVRLMAGVKGQDEAGVERCRHVDLSRDRAMLERAIQETPDCRLLIVDPISAYLGRTDSHRNSDVRAMLAPLADLARRRRVAVLAVTHLSKDEGRAIYRSMGSLAFAAAARAVWVVAEDRDAPERRLFVPAKNNLANSQEGLAYRIACGPSIAWEEGRVRISADEALAAPRSSDPPQGAMAEAIAWLADRLVAGPVAACEVKECAKMDGIATKTLERAKSRLGVIAGKTGFVSGWQWRLPEPAGKADGSAEKPPAS